LSEIVSKNIPSEMPGCGKYVFKYSLMYMKHMVNIIYLTLQEAS